MKDEFVAMVSHELRTPLNAILGWTQLMTRGHADAATMEQGLDIVAKNTRLQAQLISDLLDISRIVSGNLELELQPIDLHQLVADAIATVRPEAETRRIAINEELDTRVHGVTGDQARLQQVLWNLLSNAVKFTPDGGRIDVALRAMPGHAESTVADNGTGIRADVLPHAVRTVSSGRRSITRRFGGLGLGLSIVKHLVEPHGGTARAASAGVGQGATLTITLPMTTAARARSDAGGALPTRAPVAGLDARPRRRRAGPREFLRRFEGCGARCSRSVRAEALTAFRSDPLTF